MKYPLLLLLGLSAGALAADEAEEVPEKPGTRDCVNLQAIDQTRVVNDSTILFYMVGKEVYVNRLPIPCRGLKRTDALGWATSLSSLCSVDAISGLRWSGNRMYTAVRCGLGKFVPIDELELEALLAKPKIEPAEEPIEAEIESPDPAP